METITIEALSETLHDLDPGEIERWIAQDWVRPDGEPGHWRFRDIDVARLRLIQELRYEVGVEEAGLPVVLSLMDQLYDSRNQLRLLRDALDRMPDEARQTVMGAIRTLS